MATKTKRNSRIICFVSVSDENVFPEDIGAGK